MNLSRGPRLLGLEEEEEEEEVPAVAVAVVVVVVMVMDLMGFLVVEEETDLLVEALLLSMLGPHLSPLTRQAHHLGSPNPVRRTRSVPWQNGLFEDGLRAAGVSGVDVETRLHITNLDNGVTNDDIRELFSEIGELKRYAIHFDKNGRPSGTAEVVYPRRSDAIQALKKYNNVLLDGRPMRLEILGGNNYEAPPLSGRVNVNVSGLNGRLKRTVVIQQGGGRAIGRLRGRGRGGRGPAPTVNRLPIQNRQGGGRGGFRGGRGRGGRGRGGGRGNGKKPVEKSAADLDKDLESYHADAMNTS
ncbi:unnamed protein product [Brassica oleracea]